MSVRTSNGDDGCTQGPAGRRLAKSDPLIEAVGTIDELNSHIGLCLAAAQDEAPNVVGEALQPVQTELFAIAAAVVGRAGRESGAALDGSAAARMERQIDAISSTLPALAHFLVPGGCELASRLHVARTVCRRAERRVVGALDCDNEKAAAAVRYLNRLSDLLFVLARQTNKLRGSAESIWNP